MQCLSHGADTGLSGCVSVAFQNVMAGGCQACSEDGGPTAKARQCPEDLVRALGVE